MPYKDGGEPERAPIPARPVPEAPPQVRELLLSAHTHDDGSYFHKTPEWVQQTIRNLPEIIEAVKQSIYEDIYPDDGDKLTERTFHGDLPEMRDTQLADESARLRMRLHMELSPSLWLKDRLRAIANEEQRRRRADELIEGDDE